ncbi:MAG: cellulose biosynthesis cyclic di-GMP-binding regulatory protein BcsB [Shinella sp.]|nr:cellulose biosynthesis cyclic di-GMP-binding regulatory protein BcsB [Shinella sp.]
MSSGPASQSETIAILSINDVAVGSGPVQSSGGVSDRSYDIPKNLFHPGANKISFQAVHRHRTDCSIQSTYELWSELISERTYLTFNSSIGDALSSIDDIRAVGVTREGSTHFNIVVPRLEEPSTFSTLMRLSQGLSVLAAMPNQSFIFSSTPKADSQPGEMTIAVGTANELASVLPNLPPSALSGATTAFIEGPVAGQPVLVFSGPTWQAVQNSIEGLVSPLDRPLEVARGVLATQTWTGDETPFLMGDTRLSFSQLGIPTTEFMGRRFRTGFDIAVPSDFYAEAYGEASILLDAAYSTEVLPGSHIDIYVNGSIASTVPVTAAGGGIYRHLPISVTMRHFRPGANQIEIEAILLTAADRACAPGAAMSEEPRFAIFDTSEFHMSNFARIARLPNLAAAAGTGFPYGRQTEPVALFMDRTDVQTLSVAGTFLGKLAMMAGRPIPVTVETSALAIGDRSAVFVGAVSQIPPRALKQSHIADEARTGWSNTPASEQQRINTVATFDEWRSRLRGGSWQGQITVLEEWLNRTFDISLASLRFLPAEEASFIPEDSTTFLIAQGLSPGGTGTWTLLTAPTTTELQNGMTALSEAGSWQKLDGFLTVYHGATKVVETRPATRFSFVPTQPFSLSNYRLIAANWLSTNILSYAILLTLLSILLGLATSGLLWRFGRKK